MSIVNPQSSKSWRGRTSAIFPLVFLQSLAIALAELPVTYLLRELRCAEYNLPHIPEFDVCILPEVQQAHSTDLAIYLAVVAVLSVVVSGPYGQLSDNRGRKTAMGLAATLNGLGDVWLTICALSNSPFHVPIALHVAAVLKGFGGGFSVINAAQIAYVADTSSTAARSSYMGLTLVMYWIASSIGPILSAALLEDGGFAYAFLLAAGVWALYLAYSLVVQESHAPPPQHEAGDTSADSDEADQDTSTEESTLGAWKLRVDVLLSAIVEPLKLVFGHSTLRWLGIVVFAMLFALGAFDTLVVYCDHEFGMDSIEAAIVATTMAISRSTSVLFILPIFVGVYGCIARRGTANIGNQKSRASTTEADERTPLMAEIRAVESNHKEDVLSQQSAAAQELIISRVCLVLYAIGMLFTWRSENIVEVISSTYVGSLGAAAGPSLQALLTLAAPPEGFGRVLAGFSILELAATALSGPIMFGLYNATVEVMPGLVWLVSATLLIFCAIILVLLKPVRFSGQPNTDVVTADDDHSRPATVL